MKNLSFYTTLLILLAVSFFGLELPADTLPSYEWLPVGERCEKTWIEGGVVKHELLRIDQDSCNDLAGLNSSGGRWVIHTFQPEYLAWENKETQDILEFSEGKYQLYTSQGIIPVDYLQGHLFKSNWALAKCWDIIKSGNLPDVQTAGWNDFWEPSMNKTTLIDVAPIVDASEWSGVLSKISPLAPFVDTWPDESGWKLEDSIQEHLERVDKWVHEDLIPAIEREDRGTVIRTLFHITADRIISIPPVMVGKIETEDLNVMEVINGWKLWDWMDTWIDTSVTGLTELVAQYRAQALDWGINPK